ncbi:MAG TPA: AsmA family protein, partial [Reyranella sp.]|nr:AsmA family protein [Reyranella sp.]
MRVPWRRLTWVLIAAVPIVAIAGVVWVATRDLSRYQARLTEQIRKVTGRELAAKVPLAVKLGSEPAMVAEGVTLSNAPWGSRPEMARVRKLTLYINPVSLFLGEVKIGRILLEGADILVETNDVGDANLEMLPPPDGSGPHAGENRSFRLRTTNAFPWIGTIDVRDSVLTIAEKEGRPPVVLEIPSATLRSSAPNQPLQIEGRFAAPQATPLDLTGTAGSFDGWMRGLPGNIDVQGGFGGGKIAIKGGVGVKGTTVQINSEGPDVSVFGPYIRLPMPAGGPYVLNAKAATQRSAFKVDVTTLKVGSSELTADVLFRVDRKGTATVTLNADVSRLELGDLHAAPAAPAAASAPSPAQPRLVPTVPFSASWLGRSTLSVTARLAEIVGLGSKVQNASITLTSSETRFAFRAAATVGSGSAGFDLAYDPT